MDHKESSQGYTLEVSSFTCLTCTQGCCREHSEDGHVRKGWQQGGSGHPLPSPCFLSVLCLFSLCGPPESGHGKKPGLCRHLEESPILRKYRHTSDVQVCHQRLSSAFDLLLIFLCSLIQTLTPRPNNVLLTCEPRLGTGNEAGLGTGNEAGSGTGNEARGGGKACIHNCSHSSCRVRVWRCMTMCSGVGT